MPKLPRHVRRSSISISAANYRNTEWANSSRSSRSHDYGSRNNTGARQRRSEITQAQAATTCLHWRLLGVQATGISRTQRPRLRPGATTGSYATNSGCRHESTHTRPYTSKQTHPRCAEGLLRMLKMRTAPQRERFDPPKVRRGFASRSQKCAPRHSESDLAEST